MKVIVKKRLICPLLCQYFLPDLPRVGYQHIEPILALSASSPQSYCYILPVILQKITFAKKIAPN